MKVQTVDQPLRKTRSDKVGHTRTLNRHNRKFIGWDGEGYTVNGKHYYGLFGNSEGARLTSPSLSWRECLQALFKSDGNAHHVIFAGTYDVVMMFRNEPQIWGMLKAQTVYLDQYRITFLRGKMLRVIDLELKETRTLYDVFTFFGTSFVKACEEYLGDSDTIQQIQAMKLQRDSFTKDEVINGRVNQYMTQELDMLVQLCNELRERLAMVNIHPHQWHGPGAVASTVLKMQKVKPHIGTYTDQFRRNCEAAYYGGRFEQFQRGTYEGTVYQYDIRSAYPNAMRYLPSLAGVTFEYEISPKTINPYGLYYVNHTSSASAFSIGRLPYRSPHSSIYYPPHFARGYYWGIELPDSYLSDIEHGWTPHNLSSERPFMFVEEMYEQRAKLKAANQPHQLALKLALNSLYGKLAQSKGARANGSGWTYPTFHEVIWAGWITAYTRRMIADAMLSAPTGSVIATETDSVFSTVPLDLPLGSKLGEWDLDILEGIKYIQSGVSLVKRDGNWRFKTRGFTVKRTQNEVELWSNFLANKPHRMAIRQTRFGTDPRQKHFGQWYAQEHNLTLDNNPLEKRIHDYCANCELEANTYNDTMHYLFCPPIPIGESTPYQFVWRQNEHELESDAPIAFLVTDEPTLRLEYV